MRLDQTAIQTHPNELEEEKAKTTKTHFHVWEGSSFLLWMLSSLQL